MTLISPRASLVGGIIFFAAVILLSCLCRNIAAGEERGVPRPSPVAVGMAGAIR